MQSTSTVQPLPAIFVGKDVIRERVQRYRKEKHALLSKAMREKGTGYEETKSVWYSREHVEMWLKEMDQMNADGMRVYFGAYGKEEGRPEGQLCLLMVLTRPGEVPETHEDVILEDEPEFELRKAEAKARFVMDGIFSEDGMPREYNYGAPCPPICPPPGRGSYFER